MYRIDSTAAGARKNQAADGARASEERRCRGKTCLLHGNARKQLTAPRLELVWVHLSRLRARYGTKPPIPPFTIETARQKVRLVFDDVASNNFFNTLGNIVSDPRVILLFRKRTLPSPTHPPRNPNDSPSP